MTMSVLPDDSVVIRHHAQVIHFCTKTRAIHVRAPSSRSPTGGSLLATYTFSAALRVRLCQVGPKTQLFLDLKNGARLELGELPSQDVAMVTARLVADLTRCSIEFGEGLVQALPGAPERKEEAAADEAPTPTDGVVPEDDRPTLLPEPKAHPVPALSAERAEAEPVFQRLLKESRVAKDRTESNPG